MPQSYFRLEHAFSQLIQRYSSLVLGWSMNFCSELGDARAVVQAGACIFTADSAMLQLGCILEHVFFTASPAMLRRYPRLENAFLQHCSRRPSLGRGWSMRYYSELSDATAFFQGGTYFYS